MKYQLDNSFCWQGYFQKIRMGCVLSKKDLYQNGANARFLKQVHGHSIISDRQYQGNNQEADGHISDIADVPLVIRTADCVPLHLTDGHRIALVHAGWRGTKSGIVKALLSHFKVEHVRAALGPAISACRYEVDFDLYGNWLKREPTLINSLLPCSKGGRKRLLDLKGLIRSQLLDMGIADQHISVIPVCTFDSSLPSFRRQGKQALRIYNYIYRIKS